MKNTDLDLIIVGGGIMGLFTAYYASLANIKNITIIEKYTVGNDRRSASDPQAASFSLTRSIRNDYLDPYYGRLAFEAQLLWKELQKKSPERFLITAGCLNLAKKSITPNLKKTYALQSFKTLSSLNLNRKRFSKNLLQLTYPQFSADIGCLDVDAGFLYLPEITNTLLRLLKENGVKILENTTVTSISEIKGGVSLSTDKNTFFSKNLVITTGLWTNSVIKLIKNCAIEFPIKPDRPSQCLYYIPAPYKRSLFESSRLPVFAYLDIGIYGHPIYKGKTRGVKIGFYNPPDIQKLETRIQSIKDFVRECMPSLEDAIIEEVTDADQCFYDMVADKEFIVGKLPGFSRIVIGTGWNGTGYKFAPVIGKILSQLALQSGTVYDIQRLTPDRFIK